ncbi:BppU family phage baseplate upper protein [Bacillus mobilis]|uniref:BppU family phage baseplate upper protein n=1 Tax=Bacillus mobilis TaxID=2026190 RepID=UPI0036B96856
MTFKTYDINIDLVKDASTACAIRFSQNDRNSAKLLLTITNKGAELDLSQAKSVRMSFKKPDGTRIFQNDCQPINVLKGKYQILLKTQTLAAVGNVIAQIHIEEEDRTIDSQKFFFVVDDSLASDGAIESTNEFPLIQKAIEAGKKFDGKDIDGIIAAGVKADGALPKTGGTMTGNLNFKGNQSLQWYDNDGLTRLFQMYATPTAFGVTDNKGNQNIFSYDPATKKVNFNAETNLLKKTGDTITGLMTTTDNFRFKAGGERNITWRDGNDTEYIKIFANSGGNRLGLWSTKNGKSVWEYNGDSDTFYVNTNTNLLKKTGDTMTGHLGIDGGLTFRGSGATYDMRPFTGGVFSKGFRHTVNTSGNYYAIAPVDAAGTANWSNQLRFDGDTGKLIVKEFATSKDGRANLTLTADGELISPNGVIADRRGNTVTLRAGVRRKVGIPHTNAIFTLPTDMRPLLTVQQSVISTDGTPCVVNIQTNGEFSIQNAGSNNAQGKDYYITISYAVD